MPKRIFYSLLILTVTAAVCAAAEFDVNLTFGDGAVGRGSFVTDTTFTTIVSWNFTVTGSPTASHNFATPPGGILFQSGPTTTCGAAPQLLWFFPSPFTGYVIVCLSTDLGANGATVDASKSVDCDAGGSCVTAVTGFLTPAGNEALIGYSANLTAGDSIIDLTNVGSVSGVEPAGDICANVYVFAEDQQMVSCCTCQLTPNHLMTLSTQADLISNTLTAGVPTAISTMLVASTGNCDASTVLQPVSGLRAWGTTLHAVPGGSFAVTEFPYSTVSLSNSELAKLTTSCGYIEANGSGFGVCASCTLGAAGAKKQ
ncbi:MAG TPA: hypothetical protein VLY24_15630 [Bryobacteraceae bacterium]|nr:hypothetical protein [Bryobacteraceae bacterium]